jgi:hypothetical protein
MDLINKGDDAALHTIPGVGDVKKAAIKKARPFKSLDDLIMVDGIGAGTFDGIIDWTKKGMPADAPAAKAEPKPDAKKAASDKADPLKKSPADRVDPLKDAKRTAKGAADKAADKAAAEAAKKVVK